MLNLIGNLILDDVYTVDYWPDENTSNEFNKNYKNIGGIGNILKALDPYDIEIGITAKLGGDENGTYYDKDGHYISSKLRANYFDLQLSNAPTSKAIILSSPNERTSFVNWGCGKEVPEINQNNNVHWTHISYLDIIPDINLENIKSDVISVDLCLSNPGWPTINKICKQLQYIDFLIISNTEYNCFFDEYKLKNGIISNVLIKHSKYETLVSNINVPGKYNSIPNENKIINKANVLGAGDVYCGNFIANMMYYKDVHNYENIKNAVKLAHYYASEYVNT